MKKPRLAKKFLEELGRVPNVSVICEKLKLSRQTIYRWRNEDPGFCERFDEMLEVGRDGITDLAESKLITNLNKGSMRAIEFWLTNNTRRYHKPKKPIDPPAEKPKPMVFNLFLNKKLVESKIINHESGGKSNATGTVDSKSLMGMPPAGPQVSQTTSDLKNSETSTPNTIQDNSTSP